MTNSIPDHISIEQCRELLGNEADGMSKEQIAAVRDHAAAMAHFIIDLFLEQHAAGAKDDDSAG